MAVVPAYWGLNNTWVPSPADSNNLMVDFSRNPASFPLNRYSQLVPVKRPAGKWTKMTVETAGRLKQSDVRDHLWMDGADAPRGNLNNESFAFEDFNCYRYLYADKAGTMAIENAAWDFVQWMSRRMAQQAMTGRTQLVVNAATTTGNYPTANTSDTTLINGGYQWPDGTTANLAIKKSINYARMTIMQAVLSGMEKPQYILVINPNLARHISETQEFVDMIKGSKDSYDEVQGSLSGQNPNEEFGLPRRLYGCELVVENTVKITSDKGATTPTTAFVWPDNYALMTTRPGGLVGVEGAPSFSTLTHFVWEKNDMLVETFNDIENARVSCRVRDTIDPIVTAGQAGFLFSNTMTAGT